MLSSSSGTQQQVSDFIQSTKIIEQTLSAIIHQVSEAGTGLSNAQEAIQISQSHLTTLRQQAITDLLVLKPLEAYNNKQIQTVRSVLDAVQKYHQTRNLSDWNSVRQAINQYNSNLTLQQAIVISILDKAHMPYQLDSNGNITYQFVPGPK